MRPVTVLIVAALLLLSAHAASAQRVDIVHGRVAGADSARIANATVIVIDTITSVRRSTQTDSLGNYAVSIDGGTGTYTVMVQMPGFSMQRRVVVRPAGDAPIPPVDFRMMRFVAQLAAVRSVGERPRVSRSESGAEGGVGGQSTYTAAGNALTGNAIGDLAAALATIPGVTLTPGAAGGIGAVTAFGIPGDQNGVVMNGMLFGASVPRDAVRLGVISSSYDPGRGGFAGIQQSLRLYPGSNLALRTVHGSLDAPALQWTSHVSSRLGTQYGQGIVSGILSGPLQLDRLFYSTSYQLSRRSSTLTSLASGDAESLDALRLSVQSVDSLRRLLGSIGIPERTAAVPSSRETTDARVTARFDFLPSGPQVPITAPGQSIGGPSGTVDAYYLQLGGAWRRNEGVNIDPTTIASFGTQQSHGDGWAQLTAARYLSYGILNETTIGASTSQDRSTPYLDVPAARVLVSSTLTDGSSGLATIQAGGGTNPRLDSDAWSGQVRNVTGWSTWDRRHALMLTVDASTDGYRYRRDAGYGTFTFNSLADFAQGAPATFARTLTAREASGRGTTWAVGIGDLFNAAITGGAPSGTPPARPRIQYGVRFEGNQFNTTPAYNPAIDSIFHLRTDHVPGTIRVLPMVGFNWPMLHEYKTSDGFSLGRRGTLSGGIREYRGMLSTRALDGYAQQTGLPDAVQQLLCVGSAVPASNWFAYAQSVSSIPAQCAGGSAGSPLAQTAPAVALFAPGYTLYESWRPVLNFTYAESEAITLGVHATIAYNRHLPSQLDVNFDGAAKFTLPGEGGRPVYVTPGDIVGATGAVAYGSSRVSQRFAHVTESASDLSGETRTFGAALTYAPLFASQPTVSGSLSLGYSYNDSREQTRGFTGSTAGDPRDVAWSTGAQARHVFTATASATVQKWANINLFARAQSGLPYTPMVQGDINGDGYANDRAYVFDPAASSDTVLARAMATLLASAPGSARACLERQRGSIAGRNSCLGPWAVPNLSLSIQPDAYRFGFRNRGTVTLFINNVLAGVDQALHGTDHLRGWGQYAYPDATLLTVRGFDASARATRYTVNPQFGSSEAYRSAYRAPFSMSIDVRLEVGPDRETQYLESLLRPRAIDRVAVLDEQQIKAKLARGSTPVDELLREKDTLRLDAAQVDSLKAIARRYSLLRDSVVADIVAFLSERRGDYGGAAVRNQWHQAGTLTYGAYVTAAREMLAQLKPDQVELARKLPQLNGMIAVIATMTDADLRNRLRNPLSTLP